MQCPFARDEPQARERLKEMMLYVAGLCTGDSYFGVTKLCKILYYADFMSYAVYGKAITGAKYKSLPNGPVPISLHPLKDEMVAAKEMAVVPEVVIQHARLRYVPMRTPDLSAFTGQEIAMVNTVVSLLGGQNARQVSDLSHGIAWRVYRDSEYIPYEAVFLSDAGVTDADAQRAQQLIQQHGWHDV